MCSAVPPHVLVVDDEPMIRTFLRIGLEDEGYSVETACDGAEALDKADVRRPHAVILDIMMPGMDGWEFLSTWCTRPAEGRAPVLVMSAVEDRERAQVLGAVDFFHKPFDLDVLLARLAGLLKLPVASLAGYS